jgi:hypothetical protein
MLGPFFALAARSPRRQQTFRVTLALHLLMATALTAFHVAGGIPSRTSPYIGHTLFTLAIIEGAVLIGWRLTQMPKSQSLEFLLVSPVQPARVFWAEALVGLSQLLFVTLSSTPLLIWLAAQGRYYLFLWEDIPMILAHSFLWGAFTGLGLTTWAYEPKTLRKWGERFVLGLTIIYLVVGVLLAEKLGDWLNKLPGGWGRPVEASFRYNPFWVIQDWFQWNHSIYYLWPERVFHRLLWIDGLALFFLLVFLLRSALRLKGHFHERHYSPITDPKEKNRGRIGERPLSWWSSRRVMEYSGRANIYVAGGFSTVYALYIMLRDYWPPFLGTSVFFIIETGMGGLPGIATGLVMLAAVPAAFQYGLWDSSIQERARRMELLLLSELNAGDYFLAAMAAAWRRGRGYMLAVAFLWIAGAASGRLSPEQLVGTLIASTILWLVYFVLGFWAFARGVQANTLGSLLTLGLPMIAGIVAAGLKLPEAMVIVPPGFVYAAMTQEISVGWVIAVAAYGVAGVALLRWTLHHADGFLRRWYDLNHGKKAEGAS